MNYQSLIIFEFDELYKILNEIKKDININFEKASRSQLSNLTSRSDILILTRKKIQGLNNQIIFDKFPVTILTSNLESIENLNFATIPFFKLLLFFISSLLISEC